MMAAYRVCERLKEHKALKDFAAMKTPETCLWDVRETIAGGGWHLDPSPRRPRKPSRPSASTRRKPSPDVYG